MAKLIFIDESGTSTDVIVVAGVLPEDCIQLALAELVMNITISEIPERYRKGFIFHATDILNEQIYEEGWSSDDKLRFVMRFMSIPAFLRMPIIVGMVRKDIAPKLDKGIREDRMQHLMAFQGAISKADQFIREHSYPFEKGFLIAENINEMHRHLNGMLKITKASSTTLPLNGLKRTVEEKRLNKNLQNPTIEVSRISEKIQFFPKQENSLLQLADACAYGFRRYFENRSFGEDYLKAILGSSLEKEDWDGVMSESSFHPYPRNHQSRFFLFQFFLILWRFLKRLFFYNKILKQLGYKGLYDYKFITYLYSSIVKNRFELDGA